MPARSPFHGQRPGSQAANQHVDVDGVVDDSASPPAIEFLEMTGQGRQVTSAEIHDTVSRAVFALTAFDVSRDRRRPWCITATWPEKWSSPPCNASREGLFGSRPAARRGSRRWRGATLGVEAGGRLVEETARVGGRVAASRRTSLPELRAEVVPDTKAADLHLCCALGGIRTPNLLIRRSTPQVVHR